MNRNMQRSTADTIPTSELIGLFREPIALFDADACITEVNAGFQSLFGVIGEFLRPGTSWEIFLAEAERRGVLAQDVCRDLRVVEERHLDRPEHAPIVETQLSDGTSAEIALTMLSDGGFAMRLDTKVSPGESAREIEQVMATVLDACPTCLTMARIGDGQVLYRSPAATELLGKAKNSHDHFAHRVDRADFVTALLPDARVDDMRITGRRNDGSEFPASISARMIEYRGEDVMVYSILNLADEIALQSEISRQKELVFRSEKMSALGELLAGVAHELNNPLSIVVGNALILKEEGLSSDVQRRVDKVSDAAERCVRIVRTFLSMAREQPLDLAPLSPGDVIHSAMDSFLAGAHGLETDFNAAIEQGLPDILIDETQIVQVLTNLFENASHAMSGPEYGNKINLEARQSTDGKFVAVKVADEGPGVPADIAERIFEPLFTTKSGGKGTGVGLALCNRIVSSHGGKISLEPSNGPGATFILELPVANEGHEVSEF